MTNATARVPSQVCHFPSGVGAVAGLCTCQSGRWRWKMIRRKVSRDRPIGHLAATISSSRFSNSRSDRAATTYLISTILPVTINPLDPVPVYRQLAAILRARIERNEFPPRQPLPSESQLMGEYGVSRGSVRHALQVLAEEGLTVTIQGRGTYVLPLEDN